LIRVPAAKLGWPPGQRRVADSRFGPWSAPVGRSRVTGSASLTAQISVSWD